MELAAALQFFMFPLHFIFCGSYSTVSKAHEERRGEKVFVFVARSDSWSTEGLLEGVSSGLLPFPAGVIALLASQKILPLLQA